MARASADDKLLEFRLEDASYRGKVVALGKRYCWLVQRDGRMNRLRLKDIDSFQRVSKQFRPYRAAEMRDRLRRELGRKYEVAGTTHYLVAAPKGRAEQYAEVFEQVYRQFHRYFSARGFRLQRAEFPLVAVVFRDRRAFNEHLQKDGVAGGGSLVGYYLPTSNRVALYESRVLDLSQTPDSPVAPNRVVAFGRDRGERSLRLGFDVPQPPARIQAGLQATMVHEATHQVAFNAGLHSRVGENPRWVVEGLATVFESPRIRDGGGSTRQPAAARINAEQFIAFQSFAQSRRKPKSLESFLAGDGLYRRSMSDFYAQAWAFSFYLIETRSGKYARYLKRIAERDPLKPYPAGERLADFKETVSSDLAWLESKFLRFMRRLQDDIQREQERSRRSPGRGSGSRRYR